MSDRTLAVNQFNIFVTGVLTALITIEVSGRSLENAHFSIVRMNVLSIFVESSQSTMMQDYTAKVQ